MNHGETFAGIGGFGLAASWMGWNNVFQVEIDPWCRKILKMNFPNTTQYEDIKEFKGQAGSVDILTGGFPCQPFSHAGKRKGESDDRYLWPEYFRVIREIKPAYVVGENVAGLISMENGKTLEGIFTDLESEGYQVESFIIPACGVGAWHKRNRIWILAYTGNCSDRANRGEKKEKEGIQGKYREARYTGESGRTSSYEDVSNTKSYRDKRDGGAVGKEKKKSECKNDGSIVNCSSEDARYSKEQGLEGSITKGNTCSGGCSSESGQREWNSDWWKIEPGMGRVAHGISRRMDRLKGLGNAIVPQVAFEIFQAIQKLEDARIHR